MTEAHITVKDAEKRQSTIIVKACKDTASARRLAAFIETNSAAQVIQWKFVEIENFTGSTHAGKYNSVDQQNELLFVDEEGFSIRFLLPAPNESTLGEAQETTADFAGLVKELLSKNTNLPDTVYNGGGLIAQVDLP